MSSDFRIPFHVVSKPFNLSQLFMSGGLL